MSLRHGALLAIVLVACSNADPDAERVGASSSALQITHTFDLAPKMPSHLAVMYSMSWFGIPKNDPQGPGPDPSYGNAEFNACDGGVKSDPATCSTCVLYGAGNVCQQQGAAQRLTASRRRMLAGPYSASAKDPEGAARVDLMLSNVRRPCDDGAKIDAWAVQLNGTRDTPAHPSNPACTTCAISYDATIAFLNHADAAGMNGVVMPADDTTWYMKFGHDVGMGTCDDTNGNPKQSCIDAVTTDLTDMANLAKAHASALKLGGVPVLYVYMDPSQYSVGDWATMLQNARNASGQDFYVVATMQGNQPSYFQVFDAIAPWIQLNWTSTSGTTVREHAKNWAANLHASFASAVGKYSGRVLFGAVAPGFDDFTENWGGCTERQLPPGDPRDPAVLDGEFDYFAQQNVRGLVMETWDDWTEGTEFEPDVAGGASMLVHLRQNLGALYGEPADDAGDQRLTNRWTGYGQARNCAGGEAGVPPATDLSCPSADAGAPDAALDAPNDAPPSESDAGSEPTPAPSGCGCDAAGAGARGGWLAMLALGLATLARRRRK